MAIHPQVQNNIIGQNHEKYHENEMNGKQKITKTLQMTIGVACATLPTSSSFCMIRLIRAYIQHEVAVDLVKISQFTKH